MFEKPRSKVKSKTKLQDTITAIEIIMRLKPHNWPKPKPDYEGLKFYISLSKDLKKITN